MTTQTIVPPATDDALVFGALRAGIDDIDGELLGLLAKRAALARDIGLAKRAAGRPVFDANRENAKAQQLRQQARKLGLGDGLARQLMGLLTRGSFAQQMPQGPAEAVATTPPDSESFRLARIEPGRAPTVVTVGEAQLGGGLFEVIAGPCAVETRDQIEQAADHARACGVRIMRGGAFKPRTSPYEFQGLGLQGLQWLAHAAHARGMAIVTEVTDPADAATVARHADMLQVGARNMQNVPLLRACAQTGRPVMLKRGASATIREWLCAAEYLLLAGNPNVVLCERGIRTFERETRNTLDLSSVVALRGMTHLPVMVDPSHAAGRHEWIMPLCRAAHACGAQAVIVEMHPCRDQALCDKRQALSPGQLMQITEELQQLPTRR